jgi:large subunit ribosomal protein L24
MIKLKVKKGDTVEVLTGKDRGKKGKVMGTNPERRTALVERINLVKHFERRTRQDQPGGIIEREAPIAIAKLAVVCPKCNKPTRVGIRVTEQSRQRVCKRCQEVLGG